jgi:large subunit ribosomal protein L35
MLYRPARRAPRALHTTAASGRCAAGLLQYTVAMPKMKTHSGAKKRFRKTSKGKLVGRHAFTSHNLGHKSAKRRRRLEQPLLVSKADEARVRELIHK